MTTRTANFQVEQVDEYLLRAEDIRHTSAPAATTAPRQALAQAADRLSQAGVLRAHLDAMLEAMAALVSILYDADEDGMPANYDYVTRRILIVLPWGDSGWQQWGGLRKWEAIIMRKILIARVKEPRRRPPLFDYGNRQWFLNTRDYPNAKAALEWLRKEGPSLAEWRTAVLAYRQGETERMRRRRE